LGFAQRRHGILDPADGQPLPQHPLVGAGFQRQPQRLDSWGSSSPGRTLAPPKFPVQAGVPADGRHACTESGHACVCGAHTPGR
jgi:hypothetical protein